jgi:hypothetical protein
MIYYQKEALKPLLLVHLLWQMQFLRRKFVVQKTIYESPENSSGLCYPDDGAFIL